MTTLADYATDDEDADEPCLCERHPDGPGCFEHYRRARDGDVEEVSDS